VNYERYASAAPNEPLPPLCAEALQALGEAAAALGLPFDANHVRTMPKADLYRIALRVYTSPAVFRGINEALRKDAEAGLEKWGGTIVVIRQAIRAHGEDPARGWVKRCDVWRGMCASAEVIEKYKHIGLQFLWAGVVSTSKSEGTAKVFGGGETANLLFRIRCNENGTGLTYALDIQEFSQFPGEEEVVLYPYSGYEVTGWTEDGPLTIVALKTVDTKMIEAKNKKKYADTLKTAIMYIREAAAAVCSIGGAVVLLSFVLQLFFRPLPGTEDTYFVPLLTRWFCTLAVCLCQFVTYFVPLLCTLAACLGQFVYYSFLSVCVALDAILHAYYA
jgi:hypothetical protein